jgi:hypothetical protein
MNDIRHIATFTQVAPPLTVEAPVWCPHYSEKKLCAFCSKFNYPSITDCSGSVISVKPLQKSITIDSVLVNTPLTK